MNTTAILILIIVGSFLIIGNEVPDKKIVSGKEIIN